MRPVDASPPGNGNVRDVIVYAAVIHLLRRRLLSVPVSIFAFIPKGEQRSAPDIP